ncbi:MAG TPA: LacI family DNA-binding transcriptional regulator, partial [Rhodothermales bacterium]|nr:LacI family DNA-binding transcriptional regulator [Rhodothermales bacterium]
MRPTIRDVAREAGVSISTVSRVLNDTCPVRDDKRRRVEETVARMGYTPDPTARSLLKRETGGVGVLLPSVSEEFFSEFLTGIDRFAQQNGYYLLISASHRNKAEFERALLSMYGRVD